MRFRQAITGRFRHIAIAMILVSNASFGWSANEQSAPAKTGRFEIRFDTPSVLASKKVAARRFGSKEELIDLKLADEVFQVYVPADYQPDGTYGLFVFISPGRKGFMCRDDWLPILRDRKLIWISADQSGNDRPVLDRVRLAVEAAGQMQRQYSVDPRRIFVGGLSGGGKAAAMTAIAYGDLFQGSFSMCGMIFYRNVPAEPGRVYPAALPPPAAPLLKTIRAQSRFVLLTGEKDFNRGSNLQFFKEGFQKDLFEHVTLLDVPGMGHELPPAEWFQKGIDALDTLPEHKADLKRPASVKMPVTRPG